MKLAKTIRLGASLLIVLNLLMAFGSIWVFIRMAPAIEVIIKQNERSLHACEEMLASLAAEPDSEVVLVEPFEAALKRASSNITEEEEPAFLEEIKQNYINAFNGDRAARNLTVEAITNLADINREAMVKADLKARQFGKAGAWGIVFMATAVFLVGIMFIRRQKRNLIAPLEEINQVILAVDKGDTLRRCTGVDLPKDIQSVLNGVNELLDRIGQ